MVRKKGGPLRHLEGWEVGVVAVTIAVLGTLLAVPLPVSPRDVPLPLPGSIRMPANDDHPDKGNRERQGRRKTQPPASVT